MNWITRGLELCEAYDAPPPDAMSTDDYAQMLRDYENHTIKNYPRALKLLAEFKPLAEGLIPIADVVLKLPKLNTEGARLGLEHLKQLLSELEAE